ncbi:hypothetical protein ACUNWD_06855 [Sunxiuqinia sp. A32]|uniref:hypothetical protein n=1 Tax=Sunxiuqinia sp. A32 TaxID=3461496 RepID=UPI004045A327
MKRLFFIAIALCIAANGISCKNEVVIEEKPGPDPNTEVDPPLDEEGGPVSAMGDFLVATDDLGRSLPSFEEVGDEKKDRFIGLFYWLWHTPIRYDRSEDFNVTEELQKNPTRTQWLFADYYWAEPELGYYSSLDEFVMRKHLALFSLVGIDFLYLDFTNAIINNPELRSFLKVMKEMEADGYNLPKIVPFFNHDPQPKIEEFYTDFYLNPEYRKHMFYYEGKPLVLSPEKHKTNWQINNSFTWRAMWATFEANSENEGKWRFFDQVPMSPAFWNGRLEQIVVAPSFGGPIWDVPQYGSKSSTTSHTPTYNQYWLTEDTGKGLFFEEQWNEAHRIGAKILCITGWNEWKAGAWYCSPELAAANFPMQNRILKEGESYFVDEFNEEFNRDLEPQLGGYTDNYFYQMAANIRLYKGMKPMPEVSEPKKVSIDGLFDEWSDVSPIFQDFKNDTKSRGAQSVFSHIYYSNNTGRNDIIESRVTYDSEFVYFYVKTANQLTSYEDKNWMLLYIDSDRDKSTGWEGYDYVINLDSESSTKTSLHKRENNSWKKIADCNYSYAGNELEVAIPLSLIKQNDEPDLYFHWIDNIQEIDDIHEFFVNGDSAPERRYNYYYKSK